MKRFTGLSRDDGDVVGNAPIFAHSDGDPLPDIPNGTDNTAGVVGLGLHGSGSPSEWENMGALPTPFPSARPMPVNRFTNQYDALFDGGYDSEGALPFYDDLALDETEEHYEEESISSGIALPPLAVAHTSISEAMVVMLNVAALKN